MCNDTFWYGFTFDRGNLLVSSRFSTGDLNFCIHSNPLWEPCVEKKRSCSEHQCIGLLEEHCGNYIMSMLNLQIHLLWETSQQHECGIKQNKLSESIYQYIYIHTHTHTWICVSEFMNKLFFKTHLDTCMCEFMNKKWFSRLTLSRWPQAGGVYRLKSFVQLQVGCSLLILCVLVCCIVFYQKYFSETFP